ncbi:acyltransferase [Microbacteriaceae bacterium K1510]|nr:acyltransferase [Microbacteriaceae bacterium K1510]
MASVDISEQGRSRHMEEPASPHLDALRILASAGIVILHYANYVEDIPFGRFVFTQIRHFGLFVDLFFVISGIVIASQYIGRVSDRGGIGRFLWRRLARIYPLHLVTLAFYVVVALLFTFGHAHVDNPARYPFSDIPAQVLLLHAIDGQRLTFNFPSWSLSAEMMCYLLFPLMALVGLRRPRLIVFVAVAAAAILTLYCLATGVEAWPEWINQGGAWRALPAFLLGVALRLFRDRVAQVPIGVVLLPAFVLFVFGGWAMPVYAAAALIYLVAIAAVQCDLSGAATVLSRSGVGRWAHLTYSTYMLHMPVATVVITLGGRLLGLNTVAGRLALIAGAMIALVFVSTASYRLFENPVRRRLNDLFDRWRSRGAALPVLATPERGAP